MSPRLKSLLANTALAVGSTVFTCAALFAGGELVMRTKYGAVPPGPPLGWARYDEQRGWAMKPGRYSYFDVQAARRVQVSVNELGLRGGPVAPQPPQGVQRITVLGDSFIFGPPVDDHETIPSRLQALAGKGYEIVGVAAPGYGTGQEYRLLEELRAKGYQPGGKLILAFFTNDIQDNLGLEYSTLTPQPPQPVFDVDAAGNLQAKTFPAPKPHLGPREKPSLLERSLFWSYLRYQIDALVVSQPAILTTLDALGLTPRLPRTPGIVSGWYAPQWEERWQTTERVLDYVVRALRSQPDAPELYIAFVPSPFQLENGFRAAAKVNAKSDPAYQGFLENPDRPQHLLGAFAKRAGVPFIDLTPAVRQASLKAMMYFPREGHFNEAGNALAARVLYDKILAPAGRQAGD